MMARNVLESFTLLANVSRLFADKCIDGLVANEERLRTLAESSPSIVTPLNSAIGYEEAADVAKQALKEKKTIRQTVIDRGLIGDKLSPKSSTASSTCWRWPTSTAENTNGRHLAGGDGRSRSGSGQVREFRASLLARFAEIGAGEDVPALQQRLEHQCVLVGTVVDARLGQRLVARSATGQIHVRRPEVGDSIGDRAHTLVGNQVEGGGDEHGEELGLQLVVGGQLLGHRGDDRVLAERGGVAMTDRGS